MHKLSNIHNVTVIIAVCVMCFFLCTGCGSRDNTTVYEGFYFDTYINVTIYGKCDKGIVNELDELCKKYDVMLSEGNAGGDIGRLNASETGCLVDAETAGLIADALEYAADTGGMVDPTVMTVSELWNFSGETNEVPDNELINDALKYVDYRNVTVDGKAVLLAPGTKITLGFIAKGYIADRIAEYLKGKGVKNAIINLGGNVMCIGGKQDGKAFAVGIKKPFTEGEMLRTIEVNDASVVTSGIYERCFYADGELYHHILSTQTGYPIHNYIDGREVYSVTIVGPSSEVCDALSTTLFILGYDAGQKYIEDYEGYGAIFADCDGKMYTAGERGYFE